ncbi:unnamed protein product [Adineta steineri]|uniref:Uncharacterized protein n=1 Tax=Adineta steineri TaxID=433720 RepID=A0A818YVB2_9BILA|nr:unnamed protein product [Adineta steineri]CAF3759198.1 unnamed protein product [Adineta steineri]
MDPVYISRRRNQQYHRRRRRHHLLVEQRKRQYHHQQRYQHTIDVPTLISCLTVTIKSDKYIIFSIDSHHYICRIPSLSTVNISSFGVFDTSPPAHHPSTARFIDDKQQPDHPDYSQFDINNI